MAGPLISNLVLEDTNALRLAALPPQFAELFPTYLLAIAGPLDHGPVSSLIFKFNDVVLMRIDRPTPPDTFDLNPRSFAGD